MTKVEIKDVEVAERIETILKYQKKYGSRGEEGDPGLICYGCAHSAALEPWPSRPSGERPCCYCVRNPEREEWLKRSEASIERKPDEDGFDFNPFAGNRYNGRPALKNPMDNYVTLDHQDQEQWDDEHPENKQSVRISPGGKVQVVEK